MNQIAANPITTICLTCCFLLSAPIHAAAVRTVVLSGQPAPGTPDGVRFGGVLGGLFLNNAGQTAFGSFLTGTGVDNSNNQGIWSEGSGSLALVARLGYVARFADGAASKREELLRIKFLGGWPEKYLVFLARLDSLKSFISDPGDTLGDLPFLSPGKTR